MPNGGYPRYLVAVFPESDLALHLDQTTISIVRMNPKRPDGRWPKPLFTTLATFDPDRLQALVYHLAYWGSLRSQTRSRDEWTFLARPLSRRPAVRGCLYDY